VTYHPASGPSDTYQPDVTPALITDIHAVLERHGWQLDADGHTALVCALWQLANRPGTTARSQDGAVGGEAR